MPSLIEFLCCSQLDTSVLSEVSTGQPILERERIEWKEYPIKSNTMIFTVTLKPSNYNPSGCISMENILYNQQARFDSFIVKMKKYYNNIYYVTEQQKNLIYHYHGFIDIKDAICLSIMLCKFRKLFGRSEITQPYRSYEDWYDYIHKSPIHVRHNIKTLEAEGPIINSL